MLNIRGHWLSLMVLCAISIHFAWALIIFADPSAVGSTAVAAIQSWTKSPTLTALVVWSVATAALIGLYTDDNRWCVGLLLPQQLVLMFSAAGSTEAIYLQQFADGVIRPFGFIAADQVDTILIAFWHTIAVGAHVLRMAAGRYEVNG